MLLCNKYESQLGITNDTGAFGPTTKTAAKEKDQSGQKAIENEEQRQVRREQAHVNLERQDTERNEARLEQ